MTQTFWVVYFNLHFTNWENQEDLQKSILL